VVHRIQTTADFVPGQMRPYRVPDAVKPEVDRQIQDLLDKAKLRFSRPSCVNVLNTLVGVSYKVRMGVYMRVFK